VLAAGSVLHHREGVAEAHTAIDARQDEGVDDEVPVDATLEMDVSLVAQAVDEYLSSSGEAQRQELIAQLTALDAQISKSDFYEGSILGSGIFGYAFKGAVVGETSSHPFVEDITGAKLRAQIALVKAASWRSSHHLPRRWML
jgi:hypothetical protein